MGTKSSPKPFDCYANLYPDEPYFLVRAKDLQAPDLVRAWARERRLRVGRGECPLEDLEQVREALQCATDMEAWRADHRAGVSSSRPDGRTTQETDHGRPDSPLAAATRCEP